MSPYTFIFHDVCESGEEASSGFQGASADHYKLTPAAFRNSLAALLGASARIDGETCKPLTRDAQVAGVERQRVCLTFDDGGASAIKFVAPELEARGLKGLFFIATEKIGAPGFVTADDIRELSTRGHQIGSHSHSHPERIAALSYESIEREWLVSVAVLREIVGKAVRVASIPGGFYSRAVATAAFASGISDLYTSEPTTRTWIVGGCRCHGRFSVTRQTEASELAAIAEGRPLPAARQFVLWNAKKLMKKVGGRTWHRIRAHYFLSRR